MGQRPEFIECVRWKGAKQLSHLKKKQEKKLCEEKTKKTFGENILSFGVLIHVWRFFFPSFFSRCGALIRLARLGSALPAVLVALLLRSKPQKSGP